MSDHIKHAEEYRAFVNTADGGQGDYSGVSNDDFRVSQPVRVRIEFDLPAGVLTHFGADAPEALADPLHRALELAASVRARVFELEGDDGEFYDLGPNGQGAYVAIMQD